ncbi:MAG: fumarylacetoacetate hydrolase family protein [Eubacteriales bacterium]|nr:fumarylacetoacetate hydrolase family protein [Eubacteriales bacterium]
MKIARFETKGKIRYGSVENGIIDMIEGDIFGSHTLTGIKYDIKGVRLLAPVAPPNIIAIGLNYRKHAAESSMKPPERPVIFVKTTNSIIGPADNIRIPEIAPGEVDYEAELTIVIGKTAKNISEQDAAEYILGYTCGNDVSARDCQLKLDAQWARGKSFDTFCPIGPYIVTDIPDPDSLSIKSRLNGKTVQESNTSDMIFPVRHLVSFCSKNMTLYPGTIIMTGTPEGVGFARKPPLFMKSGDTIEIEIEKIGILMNKVL